jgi:hypothetical protein
MTNDPLLPRDEAVQHTLLPPQRSELAPAAVKAKCRRRLSRLVWQTADWRWEDYGSGWKVGDYNFLILESTVAHDAILYAQLWSEPLEGVLFEVCSGEMNPGAKRFITDEVRSKLEALGFTIDKEEAANYRKEVGIGSPADAEVVANEMLHIFADVFEFRGRSPVTVRMVRGERAERAAVHKSLTPEDVKKVLDGAGYETFIHTFEAGPCIQAKRGGFNAAVTCDGREGNSNLYTEFDLAAYVDVPNEEGLQEVAELTTKYRFVRISVDRDGDVMFRASFSTDGGITTEAIVHFARNFEGVMHEVTRVAAKRTGRARGKGRKKQQKTAVH